MRPVRMADGCAINDALAGIYRIALQSSPNGITEVGWRMSGIG